MTRFPSGRRPVLRSALAFAGAALVGCVAVAAGPAHAQNAGCTDIQKQLLQRKAIVGRLQAMGKKLDARVACSSFGQLVSNGATVVKWIDTNKDWCQIPDAFAEGIKADHGRAQTMKAKACGIAAKQAEMEKKARQAGPGPNGGGGLLGGGGLEGSFKMPQGAL